MKGVLQMRVTYIDHSGFLVQGETHWLLFDYYQGAVPEVPEGVRLFAFASHHHPDHYAAELYRYGERAPGTRYILGCDITLNAHNRENLGITDDILARCTRMHKDDVISEGGVRAQALRSTDMGVAFCVECEGKRVYHAGDHNLWLWHQDENFDRSQRARFYEEIEKLQGLTFDAAFLPLDPRLGDEFWRGFDAFARLIEPKVIFPMHMVGDYDIIRRLKALECAKGYADRIMEIRQCGDSFQI